MAVSAVKRGLIRNEKEIKTTSDFIRTKESNEVEAGRLKKGATGSKRRD